VEISDAEVERALAQEATGSEGIEVLLSEIIIPVPPAQAAQADAVARRISQITSISEFEAAAREVSAVRSREQGGRVDWQPLSNFPAALRDIILGLAPGEVTPPLSLTGAVALLQLRDVREGAVPAAEPESIDYAVVRIPGGLSQDALSLASRLAGQVDTCTDLFGQGLPDQNITRATVAPGALPQDLALELATLDPGETTWGRTEGGGTILLFTMLCARNYALPEGASDKEAVRSALASRQLEAYSQALVADLRAAAVIQGE
jgi:peptidyl-prolyl cis-trans isomerase SurA